MKEIAEVRPMKNQINKIYIFGDSILKGVMYNTERSRYITYREERFTPVTQRGITVTNYSHMGYTVICGFEQMLSKLNRNNCDENTLVILEFGGNDSDHKWKEISALPQAEHLPMTNQTDFINTYCRMIDYVQSLGAHVACCNLVPLCAEKYMNWISQGLSRDNILQWLGDEDILYRWQESYNRMAERTALMKNVNIIDIRTPFLVNHNYKNMICDDGIHPSKIGHKIIGETICGFVNNYYQSCDKYLASGALVLSSLLLKDACKI
ncbi:MAG: SGNH/GDSL hydrolase family protein [Ruminococcaceae bacterium]|nr:SGNH/GDSL hydrolase family protein [Oscillospiraceae bacterium]